MKKVCLLIGAIVLAVSHARSESRSGDQGIGVMLGVPSGVTWKMWMDDQIALDAAVGVIGSELDLHASFLWHNFTWLHRSKDSLLEDIASAGELPFYIGLGPRILLEDDEEFGVRVPLGLAFLPHKSNFEFFLEVAPVFRFTPDTGVDGDVAIGARYYFKAIRARTNP